jgi:hypothetical protein
MSFLFAAALTVSLAFANPQPPKLEDLKATATVDNKNAGAVIMIADYSTLPDVPDAERDKAAFFKALQDQVGIEKRRIRYIDNPSDAKAIKKYVKYATYKLKKGGTLWVYVIGHGTTIKDGDNTEVVILGKRAPTDGSKASTYGVKLSDIVYEATRNKRAAKVVVVLDVGFGPTSRDHKAIGKNTPPPEWPKSLEKDNVVIWAASRNSEPAREYLGAAHGMFTYFTIGAIAGWADGALDGYKDHKVTLAEAKAYVDNAMLTLGYSQQTALIGAEANLQWVLTEGTEAEAPAAGEMRKLAMGEWLAQLQTEEDLRKEQAKTEWGKRIENGADTADKAAVQAFVDKWDRTTLTFEWTVSAPQVNAARTLLAPKPEPEPKPEPDPAADPAAASAVANASTAATKSKAKTRQGPIPAAKPPEPKAPDPTDCTDNTMLENFAMMGSLGELRVQCVEERITSSTRQTERDKLSRILLYDAEVRKASEEWADLMKRHLEDIDRSDPDLCFKYAIYLSRNNQDEGYEIIRWINYALENKDKWSAKLYVQRNDALQRLRTTTAYSMWRNSMDQLVDEGGVNPELERDAEKFRGWTKEYSREWLQYARNAGRDTHKAMQICSSAAGTSTYCSEE